MSEHLRPRAWCVQCGSARCANAGYCREHGTPVDHEHECWCANQPVETEHHEATE